MDKNLTTMGYKNKADQKAKLREYYFKHKKEMIEKSKIWRKNHPEISRQISQKWRAKNKDKTNNARLKYKYKITLEEYNKLLEVQHGLCAVCLKASRRTLVVDHCHDSKKVRGLLCDNCNLAFGLLRDDTEILMNAIKYLNNHL